ncbi:MAG: carboxypeptidase-like regulatory domain-containing protein [Bacteroidota bacterium]
MKYALGNSVLAVILGVVLALQTQGQQNILDRKITISYREKTIQEALKLLSDKTGYAINYLTSDVPKNVKITRAFQKVTLRAIIREIWGDEVLTIRAVGNSIILQSNEKKAKEVGKGSLSGKITDDKGEPVPFATVGIRGTNKGVIADETGAFKINQILEGTYLLSISSLGYQSAEVKVAIKDNQTSNLKIAVSADAEELDEVVVYGETQKEVLEKSAMAIKVVETKIAQLKTADLGEVMARTEGVSVQRSGGLGSNTRFSLNGLTDDQIRFFMDGIPLNAMGHVNGVANVPVNTVERVEVYKGVVPIRFGADALGGAVNLVSNSEFEGTHGQASYQIGSFNTHRLAGFVQHRPADHKYFVLTSAFLDRTDNNYWVDVEIPDARGRVEERRVRRFHDTYAAIGMSIEAGFRDLNFADKLSIRAFYNDSEKDLQHNLIMALPFGEAFSEASSYGGFVDWRKEIFSGLKISNVAGFSENKITWVDTANVVYKWDGSLARDLNGEIVIRPNPGENGASSDAVFSDWTYYDRFFASYQWRGKHQLKISSAPTLLERSGRDRRITDPGEVDRLTLSNKLFNFINGIEYEFKPNDKLEWTVFGKNYIQRLNTEQIVFGTDLNVIDRNRMTNNYGVGTGVRIELTENLSTKLTYERATRLPNAIEVFGDGIFIFDNVEIEPERSHNVNVDLNYVRRAASKSDLEIGISGFLRQVDSLIVLLGSGMTFIHQNVANATSKGLELNFSWTLANEKLFISGNGTWLDFRNTSETGRFEPFKGDRIPNRPYLFSNADAGYKIPDLLGDQNNLQLFLGARYVHKFFRGWESVGDPDRKQFIPRQLTQNAGLTQDLQKDELKFTFTLEVQNISNAKVFDFFGVQRPGRNFNAKLLMKF